MKERTNRSPAPPGNRSEEPRRGSALVLAIFVLAILAGAGLMLLVLSQNELKMNQASLQTKKAFFSAEAGLEDGRATLLESIDSLTLDQQLTAASGSDGVFDFDPAALRVVYDDSGQAVGFEGYGDDVPLRAPTVLGDGVYAAFLTNDPEEMDDTDPKDDSNEKVTIYGVGTGTGNSIEVVQAIVEPNPLMPPPPCMLTLLGPDPTFFGGNGTCQTMGCAEGEAEEGVDPCAYGVGETESFTASAADKTFWGTDCAGSGGIAGHYVPTVCVEGCVPQNPDIQCVGEECWDGAETGADVGSEDEWTEDIGSDGECNVTAVTDMLDHPCENDYHSGPYTQDMTVANVYDLTEPSMGPGYYMDPDWLDCPKVLELIEEAEEIADFVCDHGSNCRMNTCGHWDTCPKTAGMTADSITVVKGDLDVEDGISGMGVLLVTGTLDMHANANWRGAILVLGEGVFVRSGVNGTGFMSGATVLANIAGPDGNFGNADDCTAGTNGYYPVTFTEALHAQGDTQYCTDDLGATNTLHAFTVEQFRQR